MRHVELLAVRGCATTGSTCWREQTRQKRSLAFFLEGRDVLLGKTKRAGDKRRRPGTETERCGTTCKELCRLARPQMGNLTPARRVHIPYSESVNDLWWAVRVVHVWVLLHCLHPSPRPPISRASMERPHHVSCREYTCFPPFHADRSLCESSCLRRECRGTSPMETVRGSGGRTCTVCRGVVLCSIRQKALWCVFECPIK
mmetsp:Transcript_23382/g.40239  ORF Transcript_23382/g.40239 Transcript_23382/m.40239 type:complete len:201 (+) Transcript_23382:68-670(+)